MQLRRSIIARIAHMAPGRNERVVSCRFPPLRAERRPYVVRQGTQHETQAMPTAGAGASGAQASSKGTTTSGSAGTMRNGGRGRGGTKGGGGSAQNPLRDGAGEERFAPWIFNAFRQFVQVPGVDTADGKSDVIGGESSSSSFAALEGTVLASMGMSVLSRLPLALRILAPFGLSGLEEQCMCLSHASVCLAAWFFSRFIFSFFRFSFCRSC